MIPGFYGPIVLSILLVLQTSCTQPPGAVPQAAGTVPRGQAEPGGSVLDVGEIKTTRAYLAEARFAGADLERGDLLSLACRVCHTLGPGEDHLLGPNLNGVFGRTAAAMPGFQYSPALQESGIVWTPGTLDAWLAEPAGFLPGNNMAFAGFNSASDRNDLLAHLLLATEKPAE